MHGEWKHRHVLCGTMYDDTKVSEQCRIVTSNCKQVNGMIRRNLAYENMGLYEAILLDLTWTIL